jgi:hypothetical protein
MFSILEKPALTQKSEHPPLGKTRQNAGQNIITGIFTATILASTLASLG